MSMITKKPSTIIEKIESMIAGLQLLLEFLKDKPELARKLYVSKLSFFGSIYCYSSSARERLNEQKKEFSSLIRLLSKGTRLQKQYVDTVVKVERQFSEQVGVSIQISREAVCERIVKEVIEHPAHQVEAWKEEVVEWKCK